MVIPAGSEYASLETFHSANLPVEVISPSLPPKYSVNHASPLLSTAMSNGNEFFAGREYLAKVWLVMLKFQTELLVWSVNQTRFLELSTAIPHVCSPTLDENGRIYWCTAPDDGSSSTRAEEFCRTDQTVPSDPTPTTLGSELGGREYSVTNSCL